MRTDEFDYHLPPHLIAQAPLAERDQSRLMVLRRDGATLEHHVFRELPTLLKPGDLLVMNNTRVVPARLLGRRVRTGGKWEGLFLGSMQDGAWELMCQTRGRLVHGEIIAIDPGPLELTLICQAESGTWIARPNEPFQKSPFELLDTYGHVPLPPYIRKGVDTPEDRERYQTVYADHPGAVAAPTAGLHFTPRVLDDMNRRGVQHTFVTLHVGAGTFQPIKSENIEEHRMHAEWGKLDDNAVTAIHECRERGGRVIAVGTTTVRVLESAAAGGALRAGFGEIDCYIYPPYRFRVVDALITNFHLPKSSLLVLVSAFAGVENIRRAYREAIERGYRFYSYGDAMLIV
jgi:S-adenosylmethionine:tRNA ribosyltransferase-isomerase